MLNMVKHCQTVGSRVIITGDLNEIKELSKHELEITKSLMTDENQAAILTNELQIGFYISCKHGLAFDQKNLI